MIKWLKDKIIWFFVGGIALAVIVEAELINITPLVGTGVSTTTPDVIIDYIPTELNETVNLSTYINQILIDIEKSQNQYFASTGNYFQLSSQDVIPSIGKVVSVDIDKKTNYQNESWRKLGFNFENGTPFKIKVIRYKVLLKEKVEQGYQVVFLIKVGGVEYTKSYGYGVESELRTYNWRK